MLSDALGAVIAGRAGEAAARFLRRRSARACSSKSPRRCRPTSSACCRRAIPARRAADKAAMFAEAATRRRRRARLLARRADQGRARCRSSRRPHEPPQRPRGPGRRRRLARPRQRAPRRSGTDQPHDQMGLQHRGFRAHRPPRRGRRDASPTRSVRDGEPLVYFHGGGTFHGFEWARALADEFRVYCAYHPNFGESGDAAFDGIGDYVSHYELLFPALGLDTFHLAGASMGGHMAARYAAANPDDIDKLVLDRRPAGLMSRNGLDARFRQGLPQADIPQDVRRRSRRGSSRSGRPIPRPNGARCATASRPLRSPRAKMPSATDRALRARAQGFRPPDAAAVGRGRPHRAARPSREDWQEVLPHAELAVIPGGSHLLLDEFPGRRWQFRR